MNIVQVLEHFPNAVTRNVSVDFNGDTCVEIAFKQDTYNRDHLFYKWDLYMAELEPSLIGGSWTYSKHSADECDVYTFYIKTPRIHATIN